MVAAGSTVGATFAFMVAVLPAQADTPSPACVNAKQKLNAVVIGTDNRVIIAQRAEVTAYCGTTPSSAPAPAPVPATTPAPVTIVNNPPPVTIRRANPAPPVVIEESTPQVIRRAPAPKIVQDELVVTH